MVTVFGLLKNLLIAIYKSSLCKVLLCPVISTALLIRVAFKQIPLPLSMRDSLVTLDVQ